MKKFIMALATVAILLGVSSCGARTAQSTEAVADTDTTAVADSTVAVADTVVAE